MNNCLHEAKDKKHLKPLMGGKKENWRHKKIQCGGPFEDDNLRSDAGLITETTGVFRPISK